MKIPSRWLPYVEAAAASGRAPADVRGRAMRLLEEHGNAHKRRLARTLPRRKAAATERAERTGATRATRGAVVSRAGGRCECCGAEVTSRSAELDHFFGRARSELVETCWLLCNGQEGGCHLGKTMNMPSRRFWLVRFHRHALKHGYARALQLAEQQLALEPTSETSP